MNWLKNRLREPSTSAGFAALAYGVDEFVRTGSWIGAVIAALGTFAATASDPGAGR